MNSRCASLSPYGTGFSCPKHFLSDKPVSTVRNPRDDSVSQYDAVNLAQGFRTSPHRPRLNRLLGCHRADNQHATRVELVQRVARRCIVAGDWDPKKKLSSAADRTELDRKASWRSQQGDEVLFSSLFYENYGPVRSSAEPSRAAACARHNRRMLRTFDEQNCGSFPAPDQGNHSEHPEQSTARFSAARNSN
jgi:hypothetical protein